MKIKNLNFVEKFIEKIVLVLAVVFALGVIWLKFLGQPYVVEIGGKEAGPGEVESIILDELKGLQTGIDRTDSPIRERDIPKFTDQFVRELERDITTFPLEIALGPGGLDPSIIGDSSGPLQRDFFDVPERPVVTDLNVKQGYGVMAEHRSSDVQRGFDRLIGTQRPRDFRWVSVSGKFDLGEWRNRLAAENVRDGYQRIPEEWWRPRKLAVTDVVIERQRWDLQTGEEAEIVQIEPLPSNDLSWRNPPAVWPPAEAVQTVKTIRESQREATRPTFPQLDVGTWHRPDIDISTLPPDVRKQYETKQNQINRVQERINKLEAEQKEAEAKAAEAAAAAAEGAALAAASGQPNMPTRGRPAAAGGQGEQPAETIEQLRKNLRDLEHELETLLGGGELLFDAAEARAEAAVPDKPLEEMTEEERRAAEEEAEMARIPRIVTVWGHDLTVEPGQAYRYRIKVKVVNPLFKESQVPKEQRVEYHEKLSLDSEYSEWSDWIRIEPRLHYYFVGADEQNQTVSAEIFAIFNGQRIVRQFSHSPGQRLGQVVTVPFGTFGEQRRVNMLMNVIVIDADYKWPSPVKLGGDTTRVILVDGDSGNLFYRVVAEDRVDPMRVKLRDEAKNQQQAMGN